MKASRTDRILEILDQGIGTSTEPSYAQVCPDRCTRCVRRDPVDGSDFCEPCLAFLLGDGPDLTSKETFNDPQRQHMLDFGRRLSEEGERFRSISAHIEAQLEHAKHVDNTC